MSLLIRRQGESDVIGKPAPNRWHVPEVSKFPDEAHLQDIIAESPSLLPGVPDGGVLTIKEVGFVDVLCISLDGELTICECKLRTNPEIRRKIVGQLMAYAATLWRMPYEDLERQIDLCKKDGVKLVERMQRLAEEAPELAWSGDVFQEMVSSNLAKGNFRLVFAVDEITEELKQIVEFLNAHTSSGLIVLATEIGYVRDSGVEILSPAVYGDEAVEDKDGAGRTRKWDRESFLAELKRQAPDAMPGVEALVDFAVREGAKEVFGTGRIWGTWYPVWQGRKMSDAPITVWTDGRLYINLYYFRRLQGFEQGSFVVDLQNRLGDAGLSMRMGDDTPSISCADLADEATQQTFFEVVHWLRERFYLQTHVTGPAASFDA